jgi:uncharacterized protein (UPF0297 family)
MVRQLQNTQTYPSVRGNKLEANQVLRLVYEALAEKGYNPVDQIVGYIMSGDPTYITNHKNARVLIRKAERDELLEELLSFYINKKLVAEIKMKEAV